MTIVYIPPTITELKINNKYGDTIPIYRYFAMVQLPSLLELRGHLLPWQPLYLPQPTIKQVAYNGSGNGIEEIDQVSKYKDKWQ